MLKVLQLLKVLQSRTVWVFIVLFIINGIEGVRELLPAGWLPAIDGGLGLLGIYFRTKPRVKF